MGYEVIYKFHERLESGEYDKGEVKELKRKIGDPFDEVPLEKLASAIMAQLARRDIWVLDVDIFELSKKEISFRESKGGIVIKNKKFTLDQGTNIVVEEESVSLPHNQMVSCNNNNNNNTIVLNGEQTKVNKKPMRMVTLDPDIPNLHKVKSSGLQFTEGKNYPVFAVSPHPSKIGVNIYTMHDETGREVNVIDEYFVPASANLQFGEIFEEDNRMSTPAPKLSHEQYIDAEMPDIRR